MYDITNVLEGIGLIEKTSKNCIAWRGAEHALSVLDGDGTDTAYFARKSNTGKRKNTSDISSEALHSSKSGPIKKSASSPASFMDNKKSYGQIDARRSEIGAFYEEMAFIDSFTELLKTTPFKKSELYCTQSDIIQTTKTPKEKDLNTPPSTTPTSVDADESNGTVFRHDLITAVATSDPSVTPDIVPSTNIADTSTSSIKSTTVDDLEISRTGYQNPIIDNHDFTMKGKQILALHVPSGGILEIPHPTEGCPKGVSRYELQIHSKKDDQTQDPVHVGSKHTKGKRKSPSTVIHSPLKKARKGDADSAFSTRTLANTKSVNPTNVISAFNEDDRKIEIYHLQVRYDEFKQSYKPIMDLKHITPSNFVTLKDMKLSQPSVVSSYSSSSTSYESSLLNEESSLLNEALNVDFDGDLLGDAFDLIPSHIMFEDIAFSDFYHCWDD